MERVTVLGLGRMGAAMARRLVAQGWEVAGWTRSGATVDGVTAHADPVEAVAKADLVLLALYDGPACRAVVEPIRPALGPTTVVVNTSTIGPDEAAALAADVGPTYVHAPVFGSVPAVEAGALRILAAGAIESARPVLEALGEVVPVADAATAAALKLVGNASLAGAVLTLRDCLQQAAALGLSRQQALDVLELGQLGRLVAAKRAELLGEPSPAQFTAGALAKDMALLATASRRPLRFADELASGPADPDDDIATLAMDPGVDDEVLAPLSAYIAGHATGEPAYFHQAFLPTAHIEGLRDGRLVSWSLEAYCSRFDGRPAPDEATRQRRIDTVDVHGSVATASMTLSHGSDTFTDVFLLVQVDGSWQIANKAFHRRVATPEAG